MIKKVFIIISLLVFQLLPGLANSINPMLQKADSLFSHQRFTQAFTLYDSLYKYEQQATPAMLLKMAYIKEGLGDITLAEYYLNEYYLSTSNELALQKMEDLAVANDLSGYEHNDITFFFNIYYKNYNWLVTGLIIICFVLLSIIIYHKYKHHLISWVNVFFLTILLLALFIIVNFGKTYNRGVITKNNTFIMAAPSAGANLIDVTTKGHKVIIEGAKDVWYKIEWQGHDGYIKAKNVRLLNVW